MMISHRARLPTALVATAGVLLLMALLLPASVLAQAPPPTFNFSKDNYFINDLLAGVLGPVVNPNPLNAPSTITGPGNLGDVFRVFNLGVAFFGTIIVLFIGIVGILQTGHDGEFLGRKWSSMWVPIRFTGGSLLLLPLTTSGYSFIQAFILFVAAQGVGFADTVWEKSVDTFAPKTGVSISADLPAASIAKNMLASNMCRELVNTRYNLSGFGMGNVESSKTTVVEANTNAEISTYKFATPSGEPVCGQFTYTYTPNQSDPWNPVRKKIGDEHLNLLATLDAQARPLAQQYVQALYNQDNVTPIFAQIQAWINGSASTYINTMAVAVDGAITTSPLANMNALKIAMKDAGFATAGTWYLELTKAQNAVRNGISAVPSYQSFNYDKLASEYSSENMQPVLAAMEEMLQDAAAMNPGAVKGATVANASAPGSQVTISSTPQQIEAMLDGNRRYNGAGSIIDSITRYGMEIMFVGKYSMNTNQANYNQVWGSPTTTNPNVSSLIQLKDKGDSILNIAGMIVTAQLASSVIGGAASMIPGAGGVIGKVLGAVGDTASGITTYLFAAIFAMVAFGLALAVFIPLTPYLLWIAAVGGLLVLIIEALIASVIWAVMLMHPSGEGITSDYSRQGLMILLTLFVRPTLMLMGLVCGIFLIEPLVMFVNDTYSYAVRSLQSNSITGLFSMFGFIAVYVGLMLTIVNKAFSLIHVIPDRVLRWIGGHGEQLGESDFQSRIEHLTRSGGSGMTNVIMAPVRRKK